MKSQKNFLLEEKKLFSPNNVNLHESSMSRILHHVNKGTSFGTISPFLSDLPKKENMQRLKELKHKVRNELGLGFIELYGGWTQDGVYSDELSLFIPKITKEQLYNLGVHFEQYSVIYKDKNEFIEIGTNDVSGKREILKNFKNFDIETPEKLKDENSDFHKFFSRLFKGGNHEDKRWVFSESFLYEKIPTSLNEFRNSTKEDYKPSYIKLL